MLDPNDNQNCVFCGQQEETTRHIFFECSVSYKVWMDCFKWLGISTVLQSRPCSNLIAHRRALKGKRGKKFAASIWKGRNAIIVNNSVFSGEKCVDEIKNRLWCWFSVKEVRCLNFSYSDWIGNPKMVLGCCISCNLDNAVGISYALFYSFNKKFY